MMQRKRMASLAGALSVFAAVSCGGPARASDHGRLIVDEENDLFGSSDDRHYTQGLRLSYLSGDITPGGDWDSPFGWLSDALPIFQGDGKRKIEGILGQNIFTPTNLRRADPDPHDRPYAGWLYTGASLLQDTGGRQLENLELLVGVVGPYSLAQPTQNDWHQFITVGEAHGWGHQLSNEPGLILTYERKWRLNQPLIGNFGAELIPEAGVSAGNVLTYGQIGATFRVGQNLAVDYGPVHARPSLSGTGWFDPDRLDGAFGWYAFVGAQGRAVGRNIFLDGNSFENSRSVDKKPLVADIVMGASLFWSDAVKLDFTYTDRTKEFYGQQSRDHFGMVTVSFRFW